ncbi:DNA polymerase III subunit gamma/tau [soil metagenome]
MSEETNGAGPAAYRVLARKYRPKTFADLAGQEAMVRTLSNAFSTGRIAQAYMLTGVRGIGKTTTARLIARALNYPSGASVDMPEVTPICEAILESRHIDVIEMDAASNTGIDDVREIIEAVRYAPVQARYKVYIIDEVHMLSKPAFNGLLKTLEEPPPHVKFIFATTEIRKVPVTVLSRCQRFDLKRMDSATLMALLARVAAAEGIAAEDEALRLIARAAEGSARDGLSLLDQAIAHGEGMVKAEHLQAMLGLTNRSRIIDLFDAVMGGDAGRAIVELEGQYDLGGDPHTILTDLADFVHWVTRLKIVPDAASDTARTEAERISGAAYAGKIAMSHLTRAWQMLLKGIQEVESHSDALAAAEMVLIRLAYAATLPAGEDLVKLARQEGQASSPPPPPRADPPPPRMVESARVIQPASAKAQLAVKPDSPTAPTTAEAAPIPPFASLRDVAAYLGEKRDIRLKNQVETLMRPIRVSPGQIEIALEAGAPSGLPGELARKLEAFTGLRWMVLVARDGGDKPLALQDKETRASVFQEVRDHPDVKTILARFPGAEITNVRDYADPNSAPTDEKDSDSA